MLDSLDYIRENVSIVLEKIVAAAKSAGRDPGEITLVAVSKTFSAGHIRRAFAEGITDIGENYVQEAAGKIDSLEIPARWHFLGHLQKNKVRPVVKRFSMIQSIDSASLLHRVDKICAEEGKVLDALLHVSLVREETKSGMDPSIIKGLLRDATSLSHVRIKGLMLLPPYYENPEMNRRNFAELRQLDERLNSLGFPNWEGRFLSMGMSDDYEIAIEEGANMVRVGRAIFGQRRRK